MKQLGFVIAVINIFAACQSGGHDTKTNHTTTARNGGVERSITVKNNSVSLEIKYSGDIVLNENETAIQSISPGGYVKYRKNGDKAEIKSNAKGEVSYELSNDGRKLPLDNNGREFLAAVTRDMINYGFNDTQRVERIYRSGGASALLSEVDRLATDELKAFYIEYLFSKNNLQAAEMAEAARKIGSFKPESQKRLLLTRFAADFLQRPEASEAYFAQIQNISHDHEKANVLKAVIDQPLTGEAFNHVLRVAGTIRTDAEKETVIRKLMEQGNRTDDQWIGMLKTAAQISANPEKTNILIGMAQKMPKTENVKSAYMQAAKTITSEAEYNMAVNAVKS